MAPNRSLRDQVPYRIVVWQVVAMLAVAAVLFSLSFSGEASAALAAGLASAIPAGLYAWRASVERSATSFLLQGVVKFVLTLVLVAACIIVLQPAAAGFFGTLVLMQLMYVAVPLAVGDGPSRE